MPYKYTEVDGKNKKIFISEKMMNVPKSVNFFLQVLTNRLKSDILFS